MVVVEELWLLVAAIEDETIIRLDYFRKNYDDVGYQNYSI